MRKYNKKDKKGSVRSLACFYCGKNTLNGRAVSHSKRKTLKTWHSNLQRVHVIAEGVRQHVMTCTRCLRSGFVHKAL